MSLGEPVKGANPKAHTTNMPQSQPAVNPPATRGTHPIVIPATVADLHALREAISPARLGTYLKRTHYNARLALDLYAWNIRAGAADADAAGLDR